LAAADTGGAAEVIGRKNTAGSTRRAKIEVGVTNYISDPTDVAWPVFICAMPVS
jgi:hypothetical protein